MSEPLKRKLLVAIDESNLMGAARISRKLIDWLKLRHFLLGELYDGDFSEFVVYVGLPPDTPEWAPARQKKESFVGWLRRNGFLVVTKNGSPADGGRSYKCNLDVTMALDTFDRAATAKPDAVTLVTGDADFCHLVEILRHRGMRVNVAAVNSMLGSELRLAASGVHDLDRFFDRMKPSPSPERSQSGVANDPPRVAGGAATRSVEILSHEGHWRQLDWPAERRLREELATLRSRLTALKSTPLSRGVIDVLLAQRDEFSLSENSMLRVFRMSDILEKALHATVVRDQDEHTKSYSLTILAENEDGTSTALVDPALLENIQFGKLHERAQEFANTVGSSGTVRVGGEEISATSWATLAFLLEESTAT